MNPYSLRIDKQNGFTFIEMVITIIVFSILSLSATQIIKAAINSHTVAVTMNQLDTEILMGIQRIVNDLRSASALSTIAANSLTFVDQTGTSYTYQLSGSNLQRGSYTLIDSVSSLTFSYWNSSGAVTATPASVDYVNIKS